MSVPTIIRQEQYGNVVLVIITYFDHNGFNATVQKYTVHNPGNTTLTFSSVWSTEDAAKKEFDTIVEKWA